MVQGAPARLAGYARSAWRYRRPGRQRRLRRFYSAFVSPGDLVFDLGAHMGDRTRAFAALGARVVAVEPQAELARALTRRLRSVPGVTVRQEAVGSSPGSADIAIPESNRTVATLNPDWRAAVASGNPGFAGITWHRREAVPVTTLDALIAEFGRPQFCKIDVEGYEAAVLAGLSAPLPGLSVEFVRGALDVAVRAIGHLQALDAYAANVAFGEGRQLAWPVWEDAEAAAIWLRAGAGGAASGDLYLCRRAPA